MPRATIASRQLKNKDTGLDLSVPSYREIKGLMSSTVYYQVVLVSNLACFKTPNHKESEVVQYSIEKQWSEFEELRVKVAGNFQGTSLPALNKISIIVNDQVLRQRRNNLDQLLKFMTSVPKLATCVPLLEFLGVDPGRAKRFTHSDPLERSSARDEGDRPAQDSEVYVFEDNASDQTDSVLFEEVNDVDDAFFGTEPIRAQVSMFEKQDMKAELTEEDEKDFGFIPDAIISKKETIRIFADDTEDNSDLLIIEDDLDKLMTIEVSKQGKQPRQKERELLPSSQSPPPQSPPPQSPPSSSPASVVKPNIASKPSPAPRTASKPSIASKHGDSKVAQGEAAAVKPAIANKPKSGHKPQASVGQTPAKLQSNVSGQPGSADNTSEGQSVDYKVDLTGKSMTDDSQDTLGQDDILKYLVENSAAADDGDLFS